VQLDFGGSAFPGANRFLEIHIRHPGDPAYTTLARRQQLTSTPYAIQALTALTATNNVLKGGDTMSGQLVLSADPAMALGAATKQYVDGAAATKLNVGGGTMSGTLNMGNNKITNVATPASGTDAANKSYVDSAATTGANYVFSYSTSGQTAFVDHTFQDIRFEIDGKINGWSHFPGSAPFTCLQTGLYLIEYNAQANLLTDSNSGPSIISFRVALNGTEIPGSQSAAVELVTATGSATSVVGNTVVTSVSKSSIVSINSGDLLTLQFAATAAFASLGGGGDGTTKPSASITIVKIH
jgi:hypothetical protein